MSDATDMELQHEVEQFLYRVCALCDEQAWDAYLDCFSHDVEFHIPQWDSEHRHTTDPRREMSLIYYRDRGGLEDRVFRLRTGRSSASVPMPRTLHHVGNVCCIAHEADTLHVGAKWATDYVRSGSTLRLFGNVRYRIRKTDNGMKITYKQAVVLNDKIDTVLDFYHV